MSTLKHLRVCVSDLASQSCSEKSQDTRRGRSRPRYNHPESSSEAGLWRGSAESIQTGPFKNDLQSSNCNGKNACNPSKCVIEGHKVLGWCGHEEDLSCRVSR